MDGLKNITLNAWYNIKKNIILIQRGKKHRKIMKKNNGQIYVLLKTE